MAMSKNNDHESADIKATVIAAQCNVLRFRASLPVRISNPRVPGSIPAAPTNILFSKALSKSA
jgi:hypothetical protein